MVINNYPLITYLLSQALVFCQLFNYLTVFSALTIKKLSVRIIKSCYRLIIRVLG